MPRRLPLFPSTVRPDLCGPCGGACCQRMPGICSPEDWGAPDVTTMRERLATALASGRWAVDWWEGDPRGGEYNSHDEDWVYTHPERVGRAYYVRPAIRENEGRVFHPSWGGPCTFHGTTGCALAHGEKPEECRALVPRRTSGGSCRSLRGDKQDYAVRWLPYQQTLRDVAFDREAVNLIDEMENATCSK